MNYMISGDDGNSPASPHHIETKQKEVVVCAGCKLKYDAEDTRLSLMTGEIYCSKGEFSCWREHAARHKEQNRLFGYEQTTFK